MQQKGLRNHYIHLCISQHSLW